MSEVLQADRAAPPINALPSASLPEMASWAAGLMESRAPDFIIGANYLRRWWIIPRNEHLNIYLHHILKSDDDRALHDHPWDNQSLILHGDYVEHTPDGAFQRKAGEVITRKASDAHRLEIAEHGAGAITLFITGPKVREWGFLCPQGWKHWAAFVNPNDVGQQGPGCEA